MRDPSTAPFLSLPEVERVRAAFGGHSLYFVGGCVRNFFLGAPISDLDLATDATPETVIERATAAGLKAVPTGIDHGTVTLVVGRTAFEVTTFRKDVETDGRHAVVAFSDRLEEDAQRRDFTMNALYLSLDGSLVDPTGGLCDAQRGHVRFIGDASARIAEDYLRILRFFRFTAHYGDPALGLDDAGLAACAKGVDGLAKVSAERITTELTKLLAAPDPAPAVAAMEHSGVLARVLPGADPRGLGPLVHLEAGRGVDAVRRLAVLGGDLAGLRLSRAQSRKLDLLRQQVATAQSPAELGYRLGADDAVSVLLLRGANFGTSVATSDLRAAEDASTQTLPITASDLLDRFQGSELGAELRRREAAWIESGFTLTRGALLAL